MTSEQRHVPGPATRALSAVLIGRRKRVGDEAALREVVRLEAINADLVEALKMARECIAYCRKSHANPQSGEGIPVELFIDAALAKATGSAS